MSSALTRALRVLADRLGTSSSMVSAVLFRRPSPAVEAEPPSCRTVARRDRRGSRRVASRPALPTLAAVARSAAASLLEPLEGRAMMSTTYYVSPTGNDANRGTSTAAAWKSIAKVDAVNLAPGDQVLFQGGQTFAGSLRFSAGDGGSSTNPVVIGSYNGRATISAGSANGAYVFNTGGITFSNLKIAGTPNGVTNQSGITFEAYSRGATQAAIAVDDCEISGFRQAGILVMGDYANTTFASTRLTNNSIHDNVANGIFTTAPAFNTLTNVYVGHNAVYNQLGDGVSTNSGNGITLGDVNNATVEYNTAYNNGYKGGHGDVGIWAYESNAVTFQYNASYSNHSFTNDGDGFDFDADTTNSVMQYNYAAGNDGSGFILCQWRNDNLMTGNVVRYNVAQNNGRKNNYAGIDVWGKVLNTQIYNNTVYMTAASTGTTQAIRISNLTITNLYVSNLYVSNNIFDTAGGNPIITVPSAETAGAKNIAFTGNVYYASGSTPKFAFGGKTYTSLASWQSATGQEKVAGRAVGLYADPQFLAPGAAATATPAASLASISAYQLKSTSPVTSAGVNVSTLFGVGQTKDFFGTAVPAAQISTPGVQQVTTGKTTTPTATPTPTPTSTSTSPTAFTVNAGWTGWDIGSVAKAGSNSWTGTTTATVVGSGADLWGSNDAFRYVFETVTGDGQIIAKVANPGSGSAKAGVMIRSDKSANAQNVSLDVVPTLQTILEQRATTGGATAGYVPANVTTQWIKLARKGDTVTGFYSADGSHWTAVGSTTVAIGSTYEIGLAVTAHDNTKVNTATFTNVAVSAAA